MVSGGWLVVDFLTQKSPAFAKAPAGKQAPEIEY
jgi:hypothetical protein